MPHLSLPTVAGLPLRRAIDEGTSFLFFVKSGSAPTLSVGLLYPVIPAVVVPFLLSKMAVVQMRGASSASQLDGFGTMYAASSSRLPRTAIANSPSFGAGKFYPCASGATGGGTEGRVDFLCFVIFVFGVTGVEQGEVKFREVECGGVRVHPWDLCCLSCLRYFCIRRYGDSGGRLPRLRLWGRYTGVSVTVWGVARPVSALTRGGGAPPCRVGLEREQRSFPRCVPFSVFQRAEVFCFATIPANTRWYGNDWRAAVAQWVGARAKVLVVVSIQRVYVNAFVRGRYLRYFFQLARSDDVRHYREVVPAPDLSPVPVVPSPLGYVLRMVFASWFVRERSTCNAWRYRIIANGASVLVDVCYVFHDRVRPVLVVDR